MLGAIGLFTMGLGGIVVAPPASASVSLIIRRKRPTDILMSLSIQFLVVCAQMKNATVTGGIPQFFLFRPMNMCHILEE
jgi:hypothetical protein